MIFVLVYPAIPFFGLDQQLIVPEPGVDESVAKVPPDSCVPSPRSPLRLLLFAQHPSENKAVELNKYPLTCVFLVAFVHIF